ncbi:MAG: hypothetical protein LBU45_07505 [Azoarcus sp.]|jgi:hypothetical protein|nr:hypothetical protein [Azoarcus sp.]
MSMFKPLLVALLFAASGPLLAADALEGWLVRDPPEVGSVEWYCENHAPFVWDVSVDHGRLALKKLPLEELWDVELNSVKKLPQFSVGEYKVFPRRAVRVADGYLVGYNRGEWGGAVYWFSHDAKANYGFTRRQVEHFIQRDEELFALEGYSHLISEGSFIRFRRIKGKWSYSVVTDLPGAPGPYTMDGPQHLLVVAGNQLLRLSISGEFKTLHNARSSYGKAGSIVKDAWGVIYIGTGAAVIAFHPSPSGYREQWFVRPEDEKACACRIGPHGHVICH